ncbi:MAG: D-glycero-alpha-D-manno-heptose-1,7-bisphosphate 7-phosphatase [Roseburia sp.]
MTKAIFLDRDGTINVEKNYLYKIQDFEFIPGVLEALKLLQDAGFALIIITNQSGIGRGYYAEEDFFILTGWMMKELETQGIHISKIYYCPHLPDAQVEKYRKNCKCRKPGLGMYERAIKDFNIDLSKSWSIGDKIRDCSICETTDCRGYLIEQNENADVIRGVKEGKYLNVQYAKNLLDATNKILSVTKC